MASQTAQIFNSAIAAAAISALDEVGLFDQLERERSLDLGELCRKLELHQGSMEALLHTLKGFQILEWCSKEGVVRPGPHFDDVYEEKGYFLWLVRGYGEMLRNLSTIIAQKNRVGDFAGRDGGYIALAGADYNARFVDDELAKMIDGQPFTVGADLGCGSGKRLIGFAKQRPGFRGVGVEFNGGGVELARKSIAAEKLDDRITVVQGDVKRLECCSAFGEVEVLFCFFMGHDLWPRSECIRTLDRIHEVFPKAERFVLADTYRSDLSDASDCPTFTLGFEVTHAVMGQYIPSLDEWVDLFAETKWRYAGHHDVGIPYSTMFDLRRN